MKHIVLAQELTVYVGEDDQWKGGPLYAAIVERLKDIGIAGVTVFKGIEGFGSNGKVHTTRIEVLFQGLPVLIRTIDVPERIAIALTTLDEILTEATVTVNDVQAIHYLREPKI